jgi:outer membrane protein
MRNRKTTFRFGLTFFLMAALLLTAQAQETWSLQRCIEYARDNSLTLKQAQYGIDLAKLTDRQNRLSKWPDLSGSSAGGLQFGRTIDPVTNTFDNQRISFNSFGINTGAVLYSGGRINQTIKQGEVDVKAAVEDAATAFNNIALSIANVYLQILMSEEQLTNATKRRDLSQQQLDNTDKLIQAGTLPANDRLDVLAQIATDEQAIVQSQNAIDINYLNLKELMQLDPATEIKVERPAIVIPADANPDALSFLEVYTGALGTQPQIRSAELKLQSAEYNVGIARSGMMPTLSIFGGIDTRWSSASKIVDKVTDTFVTQTVRINGMDVVVQFPSQEVTLKNNPYFDQLNENFGQNVGLSLQVPIYNNGRNEINVERAEVGILNAKLQSDQTKQQLKNDVQQAIANARAGRRTLDASQKAADASRVAFENAEKRFRLGTINNLQLLTARNTYDIAETNLIVAKYDYLFRLKILDFYLGRALKLD